MLTQSVYACFSHGRAELFHLKICIFKYIVKSRARISLALRKAYDLEIPHYNLEVYLEASFSYHINNSSNLSTDLSRIVLNNACSSVISAAICTCNHYVHS